MLLEMVRPLHPPTFSYAPDSPALKKKKQSRNSHFTGVEAETWRNQDWCLSPRSQEVVTCPPEGSQWSTAFWVCVVGEDQVTPPQLLGDSRCAACRSESSSPGPQRVGRSCSGS